MLFTGVALDGLCLLSLITLTLVLGRTVRVCVCCRRSDPGQELVSQLGADCVLRLRPRVRRAFFLRLLPCSSAPFALLGRARFALARV